MLLILMVALLRTIFAANVPLNESGVFEISVIHINDFHGRYEEISNTSSSCKNEPQYCIGGFARIYTAINQLVRDRPNPIVLNGGDNFQGTLWHTIYRWNISQHFLNLLPFDAFTLGNHEFDHDIEGVLPYLKSLKFPVLVANIDDSEEPDLHGLYNKSVVIERAGKRIGIIGVISHATNQLSNTGKLKFLDESSSVNDEARRLTAEENVNTIIVLSHCGYEADKVIAKKAAPKIGLIVGAHSHTFLYTGTPLPGLDKSRGPYPTVISQDDGRKVLVVQAAALSKYVGNLTVKYNKDGNVISWSGAPVYLNGSIKQDENIKNELQEWKIGLEAKGNRVLGHSNVLLKHNNCRYAECNMGNLITDAMVRNYLSPNESDAWTEASIALINSGGIKNSIFPGSITFSDLSSVLPFGNNLDLGEIQGKHLKRTLEYAAGNKHNWGGLDFNFLQVSGVRVVYNVTKPLGSRVQSVKVLCRKCPIPKYETLSPGKYYRVVVNSYLARGGEGNDDMKNNFRSIQKGELDVDVIERYITKQSPLISALEERIIILH